MQKIGGETIDRGERSEKRKRVGFIVKFLRDSVKKDWKGEELYFRWWYCGRECVQFSKELFKCWKIGNG
jgi:hypothetical protein